MTPNVDATWSLVAKRTPLVVRHCPRCNQKKNYYCAEKFRVNAHQNRVDVWLIYKCEHCDFTWNMTIFTRVLPKSIKPDLHQAFLDNDLETAWRYAFDFDLLKKERVEPELVVEWEIAREGMPIESATKPRMNIALGFRHKMSLRLGMVLGKELGLSRKRLDQLKEAGGLVITPIEDSDLMKRWKRPLTIELGLEAWRSLSGGAREDEADSGTD